MWQRFALSGRCGMILFARYLLPSFLDGSLQVSDLLRSLGKVIFEEVLFRCDFLELCFCLLDLNPLASGLTGVQFLQ
jgi:hypothetical protein